MTLISTGNLIGWRDAWETESVLLHQWGSFQRCLASQTATEEGDVLLPWQGEQWRHRAAWEQSWNTRGRKWRPAGVGSSPRTPTWPPWLCSTMLLVPQWIQLWTELLKPCAKLNFPPKLFLLETRQWNKKWGEWRMIPFPEGLWWTATNSQFTSSTASEREGWQPWKVSLLEQAGFSFSRLGSKLQVCEINRI